MDRRGFIKGTGLAAAALAVPARLPAQPLVASPRDMRLMEVAKRELEKAGSAIWHRDLVGISDYGVHSRLPRFHFVDLMAGRVDSMLVSHGTGSDPEHDGWLNWFSNVPNSNASSRGAYVTWEWYVGKYGVSVRLGGLDPTNNNALDRAIVAHRAAYAEPGHIERWGRLGRSNGCFAFGQDDFDRVLSQLSGGRLIYSESLGIAEDGSTIAGPSPYVPETRPLMPATPNTFERLNPGAW